jgi:lipopolysaccharide export LptBFGC system permease protein LptF
MGLLASNNELVAMRASGIPVWRIVQSVLQAGVLMLIVVIMVGELVDYLEENGLDTQQYRYAFWGRLMTPIASLVMLLISVPFVFGAMRSVSSGQRIFIGILVGFGFYVVSQISSQMGQVYALNPQLATLAPSLLFIVFGIRAIRKI